MLCNKDDCSNKAVGRGLCRKHYMQEYREEKRALQVPSYQRAHWFGTASDYWCEFCEDTGKRTQATEWAYLYTDTDREMARPIVKGVRQGDIVVYGNLPEERLPLFSENQEHYAALCHSCHEQFDRKTEISMERRLRGYIRWLAVMIERGRQPTYVEWEPHWVPKKDAKH